MPQGPRAPCAHARCAGARRQCRARSSKPQLPPRRDGPPSAVDQGGGPTSGSPPLCGHTPPAPVGGFDGARSPPCARPLPLGRTPRHAPPPARDAPPRRGWDPGALASPPPARLPGLAVVGARRRRLEKNLDGRRPSLTAAPPRRVDRAASCAPTRRATAASSPPQHLSGERTRARPGTRASSEHCGRQRGGCRGNHHRWRPLSHHRCVRVPSRRPQPEARVGDLVDAKLVGRGGRGGVS